MRASAAAQPPLGTRVRVPPHLDSTQQNQSEHHDWLSEGILNTQGFMQAGLLRPVREPCVFWQKRHRLASILRTVTVFSNP